MEENEQLLPLENNTSVDNVTYTDENIRHLDDMEHIRVRPACTSAVWGTEAKAMTVFMCC